MRVIDHLGDAGVGWRLAIALKRSQPLETIRILTDSMDIFSWMVSPEEKEQIAIICFDDLSLDTVVFSSVILESLGCRIPEPFQAIAYQQAKIILHIEALSAEPWVEKVHGKESLLGTSARRFILSTGFTPHTLGLLPAMPLSMDREAFIKAYNLNLKPDAIWIVVYTYDLDLEPWRVAAKKMDIDIELIVLEDSPRLHQRAFDTLLSLSDLNMVRGEDSFATSLQCGVPTLWQAYRLDDQFHHQKVEAFLSWARQATGECSPEWVDMMRQMNGILPPPSVKVIVSFLKQLSLLKQKAMQIQQALRSLGNYGNNVAKSLPSSKGYNPSVSKADISPVRGDYDTKRRKSALVPSDLHIKEKPPSNRGGGTKYRRGL